MLILIRFSTRMLTRALDFKRGMYPSLTYFPTCAPGVSEIINANPCCCRHRNILCIPIKNGEEVLGVAELCNKTDAPYFSTTDEELATSFAIYCGMSLVHGLMYKKVSDAQHRSNLSNELMMYHMKVSRPCNNYVTLSTS